MSLGSYHNTTKFHKKTARLISQCFYNSKINVQKVDMKMFEELCHHLNPLAAIPSSSTIDEMVTLISCEKSGRLVDPTCIICNIETDEACVFSAHPDIAAITMTAAILCGMLTMERAMKAMIGERLVMCMSHIESGNCQMRLALNFADDHTTVCSLSLDRFKMGCQMFNKMIALRHVSLDMPTYTPIGETLFRLKVKLWMDLFPFTGRNKKIMQRRSDTWCWKVNDNAERYKMTLRHLERLKNSAKASTSSANESQEPPPKAEPPKQQAEVEVPVLKEVKMEEPDEPEEDVKPTLMVPPPLIVPPPLMVPPPQTPPIVTKVDTSAVITLSNGKKVVRMPAGMTMKSGGKLVKYRIAKKRPASEKGSPAPEPPIKKPTLVQDPNG